MRMAPRIALFTLTAVLSCAGFAQGEPPPPPKPAAANPALDAAKEAIRASNWPAALAAAEGVLAENADDVVAHYLAGIALLRMSRFDEAETHLLAVERASPKFTGLNFQMGYLAYSRAEALAQDGDGEKAKPLYRQAAERFATELERSPGQIASLSSRATALGKAGDTDAAISAHEAWIAAEAAANGPVLALGNVLARDGRAEQAAAVLDRLPVKDPASIASAALTLGSLLYELEATANALPLLQRALAADPTLVNAQAKIVGVHAKLLDLDATAGALKKFLAMGPTQDEAEQVGELIREKFTSTADARAPRLERLASPRYPKQARQNNIKTDVFVLARVVRDGKVGETVIVPNRIWQEIRSLGFEEAAFDTARRSRFSPGVGADGKPAEKWAIVKVPFEP